MGWASQVALAVKNPPASADRLKRHRFDPWVRKICWRTATHSSLLAWRIPQREDPGGLQSVGSHRVRHDRSDLARTQAWGMEWPWGQLIPIHPPIFPQFLFSVNQSVSHMFPNQGLLTVRGFLQIHKCQIYAFVYHLQFSGSVASALCWIIAQSWKEWNVLMQGAWVSVFVYLELSESAKSTREDFALVLEACMELCDLLPLCDIYTSDRFSPHERCHLDKNNFNTNVFLWLH